jgi:hypothetical protein
MAARPGRAARREHAAADCPACTSIGRNGAVWPELADPSHRKTGAEAIADHLGFCARHATLLAADRWAPGLESVIADGFGILADMLADRARYEERLVDIMFHARQTCAACSIERRHASLDPAALSAAAADICFPHYRAAAARADEAELARLAAGALRSARAWTRRLDDPAADPSRTAAGALEWLCGGHAHGEAALAVHDAAQPRCSVCRAGAQAARRWIESVSTAMRLEMGLELLLPLCPWHIRIAATHDGGRHARETARQTLGPIAGALGRGLAENERAVRLDREASTSVWYRRRAPSYVLGLRRRALRMPRCGACERIDLACQRGLGEALDLVATGRGRAILAERGDLCLRHFGGVYMLCPHGEPRAALAAMQRDALLRARAALRAQSADGAWQAAAGALGAAGLA